MSLNVPDPTDKRSSLIRMLDLPPFVAAEDLPPSPGPPPQGPLPQPFIQCHEFILEYQSICASTAGNSATLVDGAQSGASPQEAKKEAQREVKKKTLKKKKKLTRAEIRRNGDASTWDVIEGIAYHVAEKYANKVKNTTKNCGRKIRGIFREKEDKEASRFDLSSCSGWPH